MSGDVERPRVRTRLKGWILLNGGLALLLVLPVAVVVTTSLLRPATTARGDGAATTTLNGLEKALRNLPHSGTRPSEQEVAQEMRDLVLAAQAAQPAVPPAFAAEGGPPPGLATEAGAPAGAGAPTTRAPVSTAAPTTEPGAHPPLPPPTTAPPPLSQPPPVTTPPTVPTTATAWSADYGAALETLASEVANPAYYSGAGSDFAPFAADVASAERYPAIPRTGAFSSVAAGAWQEALARLSALVSDGDLCVQGHNRDCHEKRLASSASSYLAYTRAALQEASTLGE